MKPIIMAGGSGSRLWPMSRQALPKQFLKLAGEETMLQATLSRLEGLDNASKPIIICNEEHRFLVAEQLRQASVQHDGILLEPFGRNTAPAIALAALHALKGGEDPVMLVLAADHLIKDSQAFHTAIAKAEALAEQGQFVTFGIVPTEPHTGYGYIQTAESTAEGLYKVAEFKEKPDLETAQSYVNSGKYLWNSGMFAFKASAYLNVLQKYAPDIRKSCEAAIADEAADLDFIRINADIFKDCPDDSIDYAVIEPLSVEADSPVSVVALDAGWSDVGSWSSLWEVSEKDEKGNAVVGDVMLHNVTNSYVNAEGKLVSLIGLDNVVVIETKDAVLVAHKDEVQDVKSIVNKLKAEKRPEYVFHREVFRPWGCYDSIDNGARYQVKRITVKPGEKLSVQMHHHRAEHWIVVSGTAKVTNGDETFLVTENESTYIPIGQVHALENPGRIPLEMIEVQSGSYLGEDDIVRFTDIYGRAPKA
ncbi:MAG TPA: mannose-1-phosphate guanylyltransferase/mannose-6-phosphate isomerase [Gammaproteobacteria bacterium]|nr:mannose-1-phosphate guanylyltransferase/mannose-6-phosphate isomerase [Gammaproteobacteria bacterium]MEC8012419.1 mannose-1-phosphate guanylyltransferase/mannose-6-phosphate isomerase [Pseudomonadota bacterium]HCK92388.1 mannose-1-phosphate guanylyltransferase/mannose-6-phosphate isomerase [Gammaproteobacteria bacterium]|tara:strand:- start:3133 stop:4563 length:1431 start_codon:yes stop_codon:yes gene_type:complete